MARYDVSMRLRSTREFLRAVNKHARSRGTTRAAFTRAALLSAMQADAAPSPRVPSARNKLKQRERELA